MFETIAVLTPLAIAALWRKSWGERFVSIAITLPIFFAIGFMQAGVRNASMGDIAGALVGAAVVPIVAIWHVARGGRNSSMRPNSILVWAVLLICVGISLPAVQDIIGGGTNVLQYLGRLFVDYSPLLLALTVTLHMEGGAVDRLLIGLGVAVMLSSLIAGVLDAPYAVVSPSDRLKGITTSPNHLGFISLVVGCLSIGILRHPYARLFLILLSFVVALWSGQRAAWLPMLALMVVWAVTAVIPSRLKGLRLIAIGLTAAGLTSVAIPFIESVVGSRELSNASRVEIWTLILQTPSLWWPAGMGSRGLYELDLTSFGLSERAFHAHNQILSWVVAGGAIAAVGCLLLLFAILRGRRGSPWIWLLLAMIAVTAVDSPLNTGGRGDLVPIALYGCIALFSLARRGRQLDPDRAISL